MKKMLLATALALLIRMCSTDIYGKTNRRLVLAKGKPSHHFFVSGIGQKKTVDAAKICGGNVRKCRAGKTFVNGLLRFITLGIYTPLETRVCAHNNCMKILSILVTLSPAH